MLTAKEQMLLDALESKAAEHGIEIVTVSVVGAKKAPTIRVYIDTPHGVSFDELSEAQSWIDPVIEQIDPFPGAYTIEVCTLNVIDGNLYNCIIHAQNHHVIFNRFNNARPGASVINRTDE